MRNELLKEILAVPTCSGQEGRMVEFVMEHVRRDCGSLPATCVVDDVNSVYIRKGEAGCGPCLAAHLDTVHRPKPVKIVEHGGVLSGRDEYGHRAGIGADDKSGIFVCLELLQELDDISVVLFGSEEVGCQGAFQARADFFTDVGCVIEFDCPGHGLVSRTSGGTPLFAEGGMFIQTAGPVLKAHGLTHWQDHPFSDVMALRQRFSFSCLNLSCGYYNWHRSDEYLALDEVAAAIAVGGDLVRALGCREYPFISNTTKSPPFDSASPQLACYA
ncbi:MAG TPA: hypothetical protein VJA21_12085 [Verrucomicrobiae bacterium]